MSTETPKDRARDPRRQVIFRNTREDQEALFSRALEAKGQEDLRTGVSRILRGSGPVGVAAAGDMALEDADTGKVGAQHGHLTVEEYQNKFPQGMPVGADELARATWNK